MEETLTEKIEGAKKLVVQELESRGLKAEWVREGEEDKSSTLIVSKTPINMSISRLYDSVPWAPSKQDKLVCEFQRVFSADYKTAMAAKTFKSDPAHATTFGLNIKKIADHIEKWFKCSLEEQAKTKAKATVDAADSKVVKRLQVAYPKATLLGRVVGVRGRFAIQGSFNEQQIEAMLKVLEVTP